MCACVRVRARYAMKCLDKKRIKMKQGETLALNERIMLSLVSTGVSDPTRATTRNAIWRLPSPLIQHGYVAVSLSVTGTRENR